jgi:uncharacterized protein YbjT (DUF2867 family)
MIYVIVGGGHVGPEIVKLLAQHGHRVRALVANAVDAKAIEGPGIEAVIGDRGRIDTCAHKLEGAEVAMLFTRNTTDL